MRAVFDLDDTISVHKNRDFKNAIPIDEAIQKIRKMKADGWEIVIYSARGQNSCHGELALIEERNRAQVETWLFEHSVPFDELRFGKPLGDVYVDDKGSGLAEFLRDEYKVLHGNSGAEIYRAGRRVLKQCKTAKEEAEWYAEASERGLKVPKVNSVVLDRIDLEYIEGETGNTKTLDDTDLYAIVSQILLMGFNKVGARFDADAYMLFIKGRLRLAEWESSFGSLMAYLAAKTPGITATFSHGDMSLSNIIFAPNGLYLIDPSSRREFSSYYNDFAKLRFSLDGGERLLHGGEQPLEYRAALEKLDSILEENRMLADVKALEAGHWIRMTGYFKKAEEREMIYRSAKKLEAEL